MEIPTWVKHNIVQKEYINSNNMSECLPGELILVPILPDQVSIEVFARVFTFLFRSLVQ